MTPVTQDTPAIREQLYLKPPVTPANKNGSYRQAQWAPKHPKEVIYTSLVLSEGQHL